jgi:hypothetical protein
MFKEHMSILYVGCIKFPTNGFIGNLCPIFNGTLGVTHRC